jgi:hypothetical protein
MGGSNLFTGVIIADIERHMLAGTRETAIEIIIQPQSLDDLVRHAENSALSPVPEINQPLSQNRAVPGLRQ